MNNTFSTLKSSLLIAVSISLLLMTQTAHADFRKALEAYQKRDGATMLKEVKDAVDKKNDDGLMLFLHAMRIDATTSAKSNLYETFKDKRPIKTTLDSILNQPQRQELFDSLSVSANTNSSMDVQYLYTDVKRLFGVSKPDNWAKTIDEYAKRGSYVANAFNTDLLARAQAGDPFSQLSVGLKYLNFVDYAGYGCQQNSKEQICQTKDEVKGYALLKQALKTYESRGHDNLGVYADSMCDLFQNTANGDKTKLRQAYLWCVVGINSGGYSSWSLLKKMNESGSLKIAAPEIDKIWGMSNQQDKDRLYKTLSLSENKELPTWIIETRKDLVKEKIPVFTYYADDYMEYELDVYADGTVKIGFGSTNNGFPGHEAGNISFVDTKKDLFMKISPKKVRVLLTELKKIGFNQWELNNDAFTFCDRPDATNCMRKHYQVVVRDRVKTRRVYLAGLAGFIDAKTIASERLAKISNLVEKFSPTQNMRCGLGTSEEYKHACVDRDSPRRAQ
jgi:hypothetical protein